MFQSIAPVNQPLIDAMEDMAREWDAYAVTWRMQGLDGIAEAARQNAEGCRKCAKDLEELNK